MADGWRVDSVGGDELGRFRGADKRSVTCTVY